MNNLVLIDYEGVKRTVPINLDKMGILEDITIRIISGDEHAVVTFRDGHVEEYDSSKTRVMHFYDGEYTLYNRTYGINRLNEFFSRRRSYDMVSLW